MDINETKSRGLIHHIILTVSDAKKSFEFYGPFFEFMGYSLIVYDSDYEDWRRVDLAGKPEVSIVQAESPDIKHQRGAVGHHHHIAFNAESRETVDELYAKVLLPMVEKGLCTIVDPPCDCSEDSGYSEGYYAVFFADPDGLRLEFCYTPTGHLKQPVIKN